MSDVEIVINCTCCGQSVNIKDCDQCTECEQYVGFCCYNPKQKKCADCEVKE